MQYTGVLDLPCKKEDAIIHGMGQTQYDKKSDYHAMERCQHQHATKLIPKLIHLILRKTQKAPQIS